VCIKVKDLGIQKTPWGKKRKILIVWQIAAVSAERHTVSKRYTASLHEKSVVYRDLKAWRGRTFTAEEVAAFDLETLVGSQCQVLVVHTERDGTIYEDVSAVSQPVPGQNVEQPVHNEEVVEGVPF
jgi:hypothetical protein